MSEHDDRYYYKPPGIPWVRGIITVLYIGLFGYTLDKLLGEHAEMTTVEVSIVSILIGALGTELKTIIGWWFRQEENGIGNNRERMN